jgi:hypothetical protein
VPASAIWKSIEESTSKNNHLVKVKSFLVGRIFFQTFQVVRDEKNLIRPALKKHASKLDKIKLEPWVSGEGRSKTICNFMSISEFIAHVQKLPPIKQMESEL